MSELMKEINETIVSVLNGVQYALGLAMRKPFLLVGVGALLVLKNKKLKLGKFLDIKL